MLLTANRQATNSFPNRKFVVKTHSKHDPELPINVKRVSFSLDDLKQRG